MITFRKHLLWALVFGVPLALSFAFGHHHFSMRAWSFASLVVCLLPVAIWRVELVRERRAERVAEPQARAGSRCGRPRRRSRRPAASTCGRCRTCRGCRPRTCRGCRSARSRSMPVAAGPARSWQERGRRKRHQVVRFDRRIEVAAQQRRPDERRPDEPQPVRELKRGRRKNHVVVRFEPPQGHQFGQRPEPASEWQLFDQAEA